MSRACVLLAVLLCACYFALGAVLFLAPFGSSANFAWKVSPFVTMTIGAWCLGNAWAALVVSRRIRQRGVRGAAIYLALFGIGESAVVFSFRHLLQLTDRPLAWLYLTALALSWPYAAALAMCANGHRVAGNYAAEAGRLGDRAVLALFILVVGFLGCYGLLAPPGARGLNATIFPEILSMFSLRSFGVFYLTLALCTVPAFLSGRRSELLAHAFAMYGLIVFITIAAAAFPEIWRFAERPHQYIYPGIYLLVGLGAAGYLLRFGSGRVPHNSEPAVRTG